VFSKVWQFAKDNPALAFLFVVFVAGVIYGSIYLFERWQFSTAEKKLDTVASAIVEELGEPTKMEKNKSCSYKSTVFENQRGLPACSVSYILKYDENIEEVNLKEGIDSVLEANNKSYKYTKYDRPSKSIDTMMVYDYSVNSLNCSITVKVINDQRLNLLVDELSAKNLILLSCGKDNTIIKPYPVN
jgi:hypothetical protein